MAMSGGGGGSMLTEINVTPLVDVMLVLLIIFMVTAPMLQTGVDVNLPQAKAQTIPDDEGKLILNFPVPTPGRVVRQFRMIDGPYAFRITAMHRDATRSRTELVRQVTLDGNSLTLNLDELSP